MPELIKSDKDWQGFIQDIEEDVDSGRPVYAKAFGSRGGMTEDIEDAFKFGCHYTGGGVTEKDGSVECIYAEKFAEGYPEQKLVLTGDNEVYLVERIPAEEELQSKPKRQSNETRTEFTLADWVDHIESTFEFFPDRGDDLPKFEARMKIKDESGDETFVGDDSSRMSRKIADGKVWRWGFA